MNLSIAAPFHHRWLIDSLVAERESVCLIAQQNANWQLQNHCPPYRKNLVSILKTECYKNPMEVGSFFACMSAIVNQSHLKGI
jgi:hypothetical protein